MTVFLTAVQTYGFDSRATAPAPDTATASLAETEMV